MSKNFKLGSLVLAKIKAFSGYYPAKIIQKPLDPQLLRKLQDNEEKFYVFFYGSYDKYLVHRDSILPYNKANRNHLILKKRVTNFTQRAIWEIDNDPYLKHESSILALNKKESFDLIASSHRKLKSIQKKFPLKICQESISLFNEAKYALNSIQNSVLKSPDLATISLMKSIKSLEVWFKSKENSLSPPKLPHHNAMNIDNLQILSFDTKEALQYYKNKHSAVQETNENDSMESIQIDNFTFKCFDSSRSLNQYLYPEKHGHQAEQAESVRKAEKIFNKILKSFFYSVSKELFIFEIYQLVKSASKNKNFIIRQILLNHGCFERVKNNYKVKWTINTDNRCIFNKNISYNQINTKRSQPISQSKQYPIIVKHLIKKSKKNLAFNHLKRNNSTKVLEDETFIYVNNDKLVEKLNDLVPIETRQHFFKLRFAKTNEWFSLSPQTMFINDSDFEF